MPTRKSRPLDFRICATNRELATKGALLAWELCHGFLRSIIAEAVGGGQCSEPLWAGGKVQ